MDQNSAAADMAPSSSTVTPLAAMACEVSTLPRRPVGHHPLPPPLLPAPPLPGPPAGPGVGEGGAGVGAAAAGHPAGPGSGP